MLTLQPELVPLVTGTWVPYRHLDYAATTPALADVWDAVGRAVRSYGSVHRGDGWPALISTQAFSNARATVGAFVGARSDDVTVFTRNTTDALSLLARALPPETHVVHFDAEHHANMLPWRRGALTCLPVPERANLVADVVAGALSRLPAGRALVTLAAASNVTGELLPVDAVVEVAHRYGARVCIDAAQVAGHQRIDLAGWGADYLAVSGHKMYAPFGAGALVGRRDWLDAAEPYLPGGGAVTRVTAGGHAWAATPARHEGGTPNVVGVVALAAAAEALAAADLDLIAKREGLLNERLRQGLGQIPGIRVLTLWDDRPSVGITAFAVTDLSPDVLSAALSAEYGIGIRAGAFCAHPLVARLLGETASCSPSAPAALRVSVGLDTTDEDVDLFLYAVRQLIEHGPVWSYRTVDDAVLPYPDPRLEMLTASPSHAAVDAAL